MVGCVGEDADGRWLRDLLAAEGVDVRELGTAPPGVATGTALITVDRDGAGQITVSPSANRHLTPDAVAAAADRFAAARVVLVQLEIPVPAVRAALVAARAHGCLTVLNPAPAPARELPADLLSMVDVLVPNEHELARLGGRPHALLQAGCGELIVTRGEAGAEWFQRSAAPIRVPAFPVAAVDTTAAGDAFCGALGAAIAGGEDRHRAIERAVAAGAVAVTRAGALTSLPQAAEVDALLSRAV
jgi:ribokinase